MIRPIRVLHVIGDLDLGGAETLLYRLASEHSPRFEHEVVCLSGRGWYSARLEEQGIAVEHLGVDGPWSALRGFARLCRGLRKRRPDVVQAWMYFGDFFASLAALGSRVPVAWGIHAASFAHLGLPSRISAYGGGVGARTLANHVIHCSKRSAQWHERFGYGRAPNSVIHNGYDPSAFTIDDEARAATRAQLGLEPDCFVIGAISRWHEEKDIPTLLGAVAKLDIAGIRCLLVGPGLDPSNQDLAAAVRFAGIEDRIVALGERDDVRGLARALDLHLLPSRSEAFPNVVAETMLSGTPNVVTDVGDSALMVGDTGWVVPPRDPDAMAAAMRNAHREWLHSGERWEARRREARRRIAEHFTFEAMVAAYRNVWESLAQQR